MARGRGKRGNKHQRSDRGGKSKFSSPRKRFSNKRANLTVEEFESKRLKHGVKPTEPEPVVSESSEDDEPEDPYKKLLSMVASVSQETRLVATVSDESEDSDESEPEDSGNQAEGELQSFEEYSETEDEGNEVAGETVVSGDKEDVPEKEELPEPEDEPLLEQDEEDDEIEKEELKSSHDPFTRHLQWELSPGLLKAVSAEEPLINTETITWPALGRLIFQIPKSADTSYKTNKLAKISIQEDTTYASPGTIPKKIQDMNWNELFVKKQIHDNIMKANKNNLQEGTDKAFTPLQYELFSIMNNYQDIYYPEHTHKNSEEIRTAYCMHAINHVLKTRTKILHHNARLQNKNDVPDDYRDQGLVRPKVIILLPFKESALRTVNLLALILLGTTKGTVMNYKRFAEDFAGSELYLPQRFPKPEDYEKTFAGNVDDNFRIGITVTKKRLKLYSDFYNSDIIIASPLGLRMIIGAEGEQDRDYDFLASVELLIADQADIFLQQNWDHVLHLWDHLHKQPRESHDADFARLRPWSLAGHSRYYRQTFIFSAVPLPELQGLINRRCHNYAGAVRVVNPVSVGSICEVTVHMPQVFHRIEASSPTQTLNARFETFTSKILPQFTEGLMSHTLVYASSYFDFVRLRNYFKRENSSFVQVCEYSKDGKVARARDMFFHNDAHFLLYTERFHFFRRMRIKGVRHLIFYQPPTYPHFYSEICNFMQEIYQNPREGGGTATNMSVTVLYSKYDIQRLAGIVGSERASRMLTSDRKVHMMVTGD